MNYLSDITYPPHDLSNVTQSKLVKRVMLTHIGRLCLELAQSILTGPLDLIVSISFDVAVRLFVFSLGVLVLIFLRSVHYNYWL